MKKLAFVLLLGSLAGCGANGEPWRPSANIGLSVGSGGVSPSASVGASNGPVTIGVGM